jgi:ABC-2 type transport system permease protein
MQVVRRARILLSVYYAHMFEWRAEILLWMLSSSFPFIMMGVWIEAGQAGKFELSSAQFAQYFIAVWIVRQFTIVWVIYEFERQVVTGELTPWLLQPMDPAWRHVARHVSERLTRIPFLIVILAVFFILVPSARFVPGLVDIVKGSVLIVLAFALRFLMQYTFALLAFWTERASSIENLWFLIYMFLGGMMAPLDVYPEGVKQVADWTPFPYLVYYPAHILLGDASGSFWQSILAISAWLLVFYVINRWLWRKALKHYSAMGA